MKYDKLFADQLIKPITTLHEAKLFIEGLVRNDLIFHLEDDPFDIIDMNGERTFTDKEATVIDKRVQEIYGKDFDWGTYDCPIGYTLDIGAFE